MEVIREYLARVKVGKKQAHLNLTLFPLWSLQEGEPNYLTLDEAMEQDQIEITEVSASGSVPDLLLVNRGTQKVLVLEGETLVGAKQDRIVNSTFLADGPCELVIPVSCVERGRWSYRSRKFHSGREIMPARMKRDHQEAVRASLSREEGFRSSQDSLWEDISSRSRRHHTHSSTEAMSDIYRTESSRLSEFVSAFRPVHGQTGALFGINGAIVGAELFGYEDTFSRFFQRLVRSYALDALDWMEGEPLRSVAAGKARAFLESAGKARAETRSSLGLGQDLRLESVSVSGTALNVDGLLLHLSMFKKERGNNPKQGEYQRFSARRSRRGH